MEEKSRIGNRCILQSARGGGHGSGGHRKRVDCLAVATGRRETQGQSSPASDLRNLGERNDLGALRVACSAAGYSETASGKSLLRLGARNVCADRARRPFG